MKIILLIIMLVLFSCGKKSEVTSVDFRESLASSATDFDGGLMLYGKDSLGRVFGRVITGSELVEDIPNGQWSFYILGWDGPSKMTGKVYCSYLPGINLSGAPVDIDFVINNDNCADVSVFGQHHSYTAPTVVHYFTNNMFFGERLPSDLLETPECLISNTGTGCSAGVQIPSKANRFVGSTNFALKSFDKSFSGSISIDNDHPQLISDCYDLSVSDYNTDAYASSAAINFPKGGNNSFPFTIAMNTFHGSVYNSSNINTNTDCSIGNNKYRKTKLLTNGLLTIKPGQLISTDLTLADGIKFFYKRIPQ